MTRKLRIGCYRHYKGQLYRVLGVARHSETQEELVVYRCLYGNGSLWVRPLAMFVETVVVGERRIPRFSWVGRRAVPSVPECGSGAVAGRAGDRQDSENLCLHYDC